MTLGENDRPAARAKARGVSVEDRGARRTRANLQASLPTGEQSAGGETQEVERVGQVERLVEVVDSPNETIVGVTPSSEALDV